MIAAIRWTPYALPFRRPLVTSHRRWDTRDGIIFEIETNSGLIGLGDVAPLSDFGTGDVTASVRQFVDVAPRLIGARVGDATCAFDAALRDEALAPLRCAIESACVDIEAQVAGKSVAALLAESPPTAVAVNAIVADDVEATSAAAAGYRCVKLKVGAATAGEDFARVAAVRRAIGPDVALRLDANGAWSEEQATAFLHDIAPHEIEFVEQPVAAGDLDAMRRVRQAVSVPVAADEDVTGAEAARRLLEAAAADILVVKPVVVGGLRRAMEIVAMARAAGVDVVVTSAMESGVGVAAALHVAAASHTERACGLATLPQLADDLVCHGLPAVGGAMTLPAGTGLGITLDSASLRRQATATSRMVRT